jgi:hypothetical protein
MSNPNLFLEALICKNKKENNRCQINKDENFQFQITFVGREQVTVGNDYFQIITLIFRKLAGCISTAC